jgi:hypothetical protein
MAMCCGSKQVWRRVLDCWQWRQDLTQVLTVLERPRKTNLEEIICQEASLPGCEILCKVKKKLFTNNWVKNVRGDVPQPSIELLLAETHFEG